MGHARLQQQHGERRQADKAAWESLDPRVHTMVHATPPVSIRNVSKSSKGEAAVDAAVSRYHGYPRDVRQPRPGAGAAMILPVALFVPRSISAMARPSASPTSRFCS